MQHREGILCKVKADDDGREPFWYDSEGFETTFVENMRMLREKKGLSQTEFAKRMQSAGHGFHQPTVQRIEAGERPVKLTEAVSIARILDSSMAAMMDELSLPFAYDMLSSEDEWEYLLADFRRAAELAQSIDFHRAQLADHRRDYLSAAARFGEEPHQGLLDYTREALSIVEETRDILRETGERMQAQADKIRALKRDFPRAHHGERPYLKRLPADETDV